MVVAATTEPRESAHQFRGCSSINDYEVLGKLGEGTFGEVHKARHKRSGGIFALKKILVHNERDGFPITALREIKLLKSLRNINILELSEMAVERSRMKDQHRKKAIMYMVTPYMDHDLSGLLENPDVNFSEAQIKCYMVQLLKGLVFLHGNHILHRDMKAANLLINNKGILQIADFGLARYFDEPTPRPGRGAGEARRDYTALVVTRWYRPPELLLGLRKYTCAIDLWGVGCVFAEMFRRKPILRGDSDQNQAHIIFDLVGSPTDENMPGWSALPGCEGIKNFGNRPGKLNHEYRDIGPVAVSLLSEFLKLDWRTRITAIDALEHPYFHTDPLPARPSDLPSYAHSHELDRRKFRDQKANALPPAPAGGTVGMGPNGELAHGHGGRDGAWGSGPPSRDPRYTGHQSRESGFDRRGPPPPYESRGRGGPPRAQQGRRPGWARDDRAEAPQQSNGRGAPAPRGDTYIPNYSGNDRQASRDRPPRDDRDRSANRDRPARDDRRDDKDKSINRDRYRDAGLPYDSHRRRSRSRSPVRERAPRDRNTELYRR